VGGHIQILAYSSNNVTDQKAQADTRILLLVQNETEQTMQTLA